MIRSQEPDMDNPAGNHEDAQKLPCKEESAKNSALAEGKHSGLLRNEHGPDKWCELVSTINAW